MNRANTVLLHFKYPGIFRDLYGDMRATAMCWGFECGDGWFEIIDRLCKRIARAGLSGHVVATQVKEKYGGLRFYYDMKSHPNPLAWELVDSFVDYAELDSIHTCETCGSTEEDVRRRGSGWIHTACDEHARS